MGTLVALGVVAGIVFGLFYPWLVLFERTFIRDLMLSRKREWKVLTAKKVLIEFQMAVAINTMRVALGQHEIKIETAADSMQEGWRWKDLLFSARSSAQKAYATIEGRWKSVQGE